MERKRKIKMDKNLIEEKIKQGEALAEVAAQAMRGMDPTINKIDMNVIRVYFTKDDYEIEFCLREREDDVEGNSVSVMIHFPEDGDQCKVINFKQDKAAAVDFIHSKGNMIIERGYSFRIKVLGD